MSTPRGETADKARQAAICAIADRLAQELKDAGEPVPSRAVLWKRAEEHYKKQSVHLT